MCGRFTNLLSWREIVELYEITNTGFRPNLAPRYNVAPSQDIPIVRAGRELAVARWGLIPSWAKDAKIGWRTINARAETVAEKPAFRAAFRARRCLVPASGFYEWQTREGGRKQPWYVSGKDGAPLSFAGLWERWDGPGGAVESCTIVVTEANDFMRRLHHRMPVILDAADFDAWLDGQADDGRALLRPCPDDRLEAWPVSTHVNKPAHDDEACVTPIQV